MGKITATFNHSRIDDDPRSGTRCEVLGEGWSEVLGEDGGVQNIRFPDGLETFAFGDELTEWRLEA